MRTIRPAFRVFFAFCILIQLAVHRPLYGQCFTDIPLSSANGGFWQNCRLLFQLPQTVSLPLDITQMIPGESYELLLQIEESQWKRAAMTVSLVGTSQEIIWHEKRPTAGVYRIPFTFQPDHRQCVFQLVEQGNNPEAEVSFFRIAIRSLDCEQQPWPGGIEQMPSIWFSAEGGPGASQRMLQDNQSVANWANMPAPGQYLLAQQTQTAFQPTFHTNRINGHSALTFDGQNDLLSLRLSDLFPKQGYNQFVLFQTEDEFGSILAATDTSLMDASVYQSELGLRFGRMSHHIRLNGVDTYAQAFEETNDATPHLGMVRVPETGMGSRTIWVDGVAVGGNTIGSFADDLRFLNIGGHSDYGAFKGDLAEFILYDEPLDDSSQMKVETYFAIRYGLQAQAKGMISPLGRSLFDEDIYDENVAGIGRSDRQWLIQNQNQSCFGSPCIEFRAQCLEDES
ncbi:MAG: hypothetical protein AAF206_22570, partial [Bacteroidota bacterium]